MVQSTNKNDKTKMKKAAKKKRERAEDEKSLVALRERERGGGMFLPGRFGTEAGNNTKWRGRKMRAERYSAPLSTPDDIKECHFWRNKSFPTSFLLKSCSF